MFEIGKNGENGKKKKNVLGTRKNGNAILFGMKQHCDMKIKFYTNSPGSIGS